MRSNHMTLCRIFETYFMVCSSLLPPPSSCLRTGVLLLGDKLYDGWYRSSRFHLSTHACALISSLDKLQRTLPHITKLSPTSLSFRPCKDPPDTPQAPLNRFWLAWTKDNSSTSTALVALVTQLPMARVDLERLDSSRRARKLRNKLYFKCIFDLKLRIA